MNLKKEFEKKFAGISYDTGDIWDWIIEKIVDEGFRMYELGFLEHKRINEASKEYEDLMYLQHKRIVEANKYWQKITKGDELVHADLGELLKFLMDRIKELEKN